MPPGRLVVGLGNPGPRYRDTRHNLGFQVVEEVARRRGLRFGGDSGEECSALVAVDLASRPPVRLALPQTYMNRSGYAVRCMVERHGFAPEDVLVVYDEIHLPLGRLRLRRNGSPAGHRGIESVLENLRTDAVPRLRLGVMPEAPVPAADWADFVLERFEAGERDAVADLVTRAADVCEIWLAEGVERAMARCNGG